MRHLNKIILSDNPEAELQSMFEDKTHRAIGFFIIGFVVGLLIVLI